MAFKDRMEVEKKVYTKPQVTEVRLVAGEAVLANCKQPGGQTICQPEDINCFPGFSQRS